MANFVFACLPLLVFIARHSLLLNMKARTRQIFLTGIGLLFGVGAVGTYARTALISLAAVLGGFFLRSRRKMLFASVAVLFAIVAAVFASEGWKDRMETITDYQDESSAETRIIIWKWAWDFVQEHPLGGGFESYMVQDVETDQIGADGEHVHVRGRAFHSIYFAILAEHGFIGLGLFLAIVLGCLRGLWQTKQQTKTRTDLAWLNDLSSNLLIGLPAFLCGAAFIDISFYPVLWYQLALAVCVRSVALRSLAEPLPEPEPVAA
jgi:probable O-glycosylation ligase (exosortase A-associated)